MVDIWTAMLGDLDFAVAKAATYKVCRESKFPPTVAEMVAAAKELDPRNDQLPSAADAWSEVFRKIQTDGQYRKPTWSTDVIGSAVSAMGWVALCSGENLEADRAHFLKIYESMRVGHNRREDNEKALQLSGMSEMVKALVEKINIKKLGGGHV